MLKNQENSKINYQKNTIYQKRNKFQSNKSNYTDKSKSKKYTYIFENNYPNSSFKSIQNNIVYKKPSLNNNTEIQNSDENIFIINDLKENIKQNETKLEKVNKTMQEILLKQNEDQNI